MIEQKYISLFGKMFVMHISEEEKCIQVFVGLIMSGCWVQSFHYIFCLAFSCRHCEPNILFDAIDWLSFLGNCSFSVAHL